MQIIPTKKFEMIDDVTSVCRRPSTADIMIMPT